MTAKAQAETTKRGKSRATTAAEDRIEILPPTVSGAEDRQRVLEPTVTVIEPEAQLGYESEGDMTDSSLVSEDQPVAASASLYQGPHRSQQGNADQDSASEGIRYDNQSTANANTSESLIAAITEMVKGAVNGIRDNVIALSENGSRFGSLQSSQMQRLPEFNGDILEWPNFKEIYEYTTRISGISDQENIQRLFKSIRGEARKIVQMQFATTRDPSKIMKDLELHFGNAKMIGENVKRELLELPNVDSRVLSTAQFASKLSNAVLAFKKLDLPTKLQDSYLFTGSRNKLPRELRFGFLDYAATASSNETNLEKLSNYMQKRAEISLSAGLLELELSATDSKRKNDRHVTGRQARAPETAAVCVSTGNSRSNDRGHSPVPTEECAFCKRGTHKVKDCAEFKKSAAPKRLDFVRNERLCFKCLGRNHRRATCRSRVVCDICRREDHVSSMHLNPEDREKISNRREERQGNERDRRESNKERRRDVQEGSKRDTVNTTRHSYSEDEPKRDHSRSRREGSEHSK